MPGPEMKVHEWLKGRIKLLPCDAFVYKPPSGAYGKKGVPDFFVCIQGKFCAIEVKADPTKVVTPMQKENLRKIREAGGYTLELYGKDLTALNNFFTSVLGATNVR